MKQFRDSKKEEKRLIKDKKFKLNKKLKNKEYVTSKQVPTRRNSFK
jgi:hypothetical protein